MRMYGTIWVLRVVLSGQDLQCLTHAVSHSGISLQQLGLMFLAS